jgi:hypothetical protein
MDPHKTIPYGIVVFGAILLLVAQFGRTFRARSPWFRSAFLLFSLFSAVWSTLGFYLASHDRGGHTDLPRSQFWALDHLKSNIVGVVVGIFIALIISPEFWRRRARTASASNQALQPTAGRSDE